MMIVSDIVTLENRGKYQGILGSCVGLGNTIGPFLAAAFVETSTWRGLFWCVCPLIVIAGGTVALTLPPSKVYGDLETKIKAIDYYGLAFSLAAILLLLIPISGGGIYFEWGSPMTFGAGLVLLSNRTTPEWEIVIILFIEGAGVGHVFQPTLVAAQAHSRKNDRAVVISVRNFVRALGGSLGLALSSTVFSNVLKKSLGSITTPLPDGYTNEILASILRVPDLTALSGVQKEEVLGAYMDASKGVFTIWAPIMGVCLALCVLIKDKGLQRAEEKEQAAPVEMSTSERDIIGGSDEETRVQTELDRSEKGEMKASG
ncbi:hypothetical protein G7Y89_g431 [Cudoniella acicularis]|uniref:Major facilitator superfamily (MFS) profile domain-containing protein n=1 Tax=Cudoniella acicularis TaxID=354080 RepID=A0A8H4W8V8_9HELO|nr:hypothetical protein G7Y89_g431 [Cudoniella acicularis]